MEEPSRKKSAVFVNREEELQEITQTVQDLQDKQRLVKTPIIEFSGVQGIGKTSLLQRIEEICSKRNVTCIAEKASAITSHHFQRIERLAEKEEPVVMIVDELDGINSESEGFRDIENSLSYLLDKRIRFFVILASRSEQKFERTRSIKRKLTMRRLKPLEQKDCRQYLSHFARTVPPDVWDSIFDWTRGYPLALSAITLAVSDQGLDLTRREDQNQLIDILMKKVVEDALLATAPNPKERTRLRRLLEVLSISRRFNITLAQDLIESFAPEYKLESSFAYITLPQTINEVTSVLTYKLELAGYCIDAPIRNLFLLHMKIAKPEEYRATQQFLAEQNEGFVQAVSGSDRVRYLREFFYHLACYAEDGVVREKLTKYIKQLAQAPGQDERSLVQSLESLLQFYEEFQRDEELKEVLEQSRTQFVLSLLYRNFIEIYGQIPENMRESRLKQFFSLVTGHSQKDDFPFIFEEGMRHIITQITRSDAIKLYNDLVQDEQLTVLLGGQSKEVKARLTDSLVDEGH